MITLQSNTTNNHNHFQLDHVFVHVPNDDNDDVMSFKSSQNTYKARQAFRATLDMVGFVGDGVGIDVGPANDGLHSIFSFSKMIGNDGGCWEIRGGAVGLIMVDIRSI